MGSRVTWEAIPGAMLAISRTAMPFLYQTKTLTGGYRRTCAAAFHTIDRRNISQNRPVRHPFSEEEAPSNAVTESATLDNETDPGDGDVKFTIKRTEIAGDPLGSRAWKPLDLESDNTPNNLKEGHSGTVVRKILVNKEFISSARPVHLGGIPVPRSSRRSNRKERKTYNTRWDDDFNEFEKVNDIKFVGSGISASTQGETVLEKDAIDELAYRHSDRESTITQAERLAFQKIFADIFTNHRVSQKGDLTLRDPLQDIFEENKEPEKTQKARTQLGRIMSQAAAENPTRDQMEQIVNRYPAPLRAAAGRAIGLDMAATQLEEHEEVTMDEAVDNKQLEESQNAERGRVETLMRAAKTDFALWTIMEEEVFPLIAKLGLGEDKGNNPETGPTQKRGRKSKKSLQKQTDEAPPSPKTDMSSPIKDEISKLELYGPLYPSYLLLGLRLLDRSFAKPSPLALSVLPKIKSLGLISQVLGASTQLYNELMKIHWYQRNDFRGVVQLLKEMEQSGLDWDDETLGIVEDIVLMQKTALNGSKGPTMKVLWTFPEFAPGVFDFWRKKIRKALQERNSHAGELLSY